MKVIELLNKIANKEEVPTPIRFRNDYYDFDDGDYFNQQHRRWIFNDNDISGILNEEIEIIEEDKKIKKLNIYHYFTSLGIDNTGRLDENLTDISNKINEIIDKINKMEDK